MPLGTLRTRNQHYLLSNTTPHATYQIFQCPANIKDRLGSCSYNSNWSSSQLCQVSTHIQSCQEASSMVLEDCVVLQTDEI